MAGISDRLTQVTDRMAQACARVGRDAGSVSLVTVTKTFGPDRVCDAADAGIRIMGENRVQEAKQKIPMCPGHLEWHMIGHLQSNKVKDTVRLFSMIHSIDSEKLLNTVNDACGAIGKTMPVCLEVNVSAESSKYGMNPDDVVGVLSSSQGLMNVDIIGLMTIPPFTEDANGARPYFRKLRLLRDECRADTGFELPELSMGMSHDFEVAIEEGATWIRLGSILFGARD